MANLVIPRREILSGQPSNLPPIIHPGFSKKDSFVYAPWISPNTIVRLGGSKKSITRGAPQPVSSRLRLAAKFVASNNDCITNQGFVQLLALPTITIAIASTGAITGAIRSIIGRSSYGNRYIGIRAGSASNTWEYQYYGSSSSVVLTGTSSFSDDEMCVITGVSYSATDHELYVNGKLEATSTTNGGADPGFDSLMVGCANDASAWDLRANGLIGLGLISQGVLSRPSVRQLAENPWQIFAPRETRLFVPVGGGAGSQTLTPSLHTNPSTFYAPTLTAGAVTLAPSSYTNSQIFYSPTVSLAGGAQQLTANRVDNASVFYSPLLSPGAVTLAPSLYNHTQTFYSLTLSASKTLSASLFTNSQTFYSPIVSLGSGPQVVAPGLFTNAQSYFTQMVAPGQVSLFPLRLTNSPAFYAATVSDGSTGIPDAATRYTVTAHRHPLSITATPRSYQVIK